MRPHPGQSPTHRAPTQEHRRGWGQHTLALMLVAATVSVGGCFSRNAAEGQFIEARSSGRYEAFESGGPNTKIRLMRLRLLQYDDDATGLLEMIQVSRYETFESFPSVLTNPSPNYFCTRLDQGTVRGDTVVFQFTDWLNRRWQVSAELSADGDEIAGRLERLSASGDPIDVQTTSDFLLPEDAYYFTAKSGDAQRQIVLTRTSTDVSTEELRCVDYQRHDQLVLDLPGPPPPKHRVALVLTRPIAGTSATTPLAGLGLEEVVTATLDDGQHLEPPIVLPVDVIGDERRLVVRVAPQQLVDIGVGIAVGVVVIYQDSGNEPDRWDNLRFRPGSPEAIWAYGRELILFNANKDAITVRAKRADGTRVALDLFAPDTVRRAGWAAYNFFATDAVLDDRSRVKLIEQINGQPTSTVTMDRLEQGECVYCDPSPIDASALPVGTPPQECSSCPAILPLLFL